MSTAIIPVVLRSGGPTNKKKHILEDPGRKRKTNWTSEEVLKHSALNPLKPNDAYRGRTAPLTSKRCILYIYSTNIGTENFKYGIYSPFFPLQNAVCFTILTYLVLYYPHFICRCAKIKKKIIPALNG